MRVEIKLHNHNYSRLTATDEIPATSPRFVSLDFMRGLIMVLLAFESCRLYDHLHDASKGSFWHLFFEQFFHHPWNGLRFWDLIQPGFMFIAGTAMAFSLQKQQERGTIFSIEWYICYFLYRKKIFLQTVNHFDAGIVFIVFIRGINLFTYEKSIYHFRRGYHLFVQC